MGFEGNIEKCFVCICLNTGTTLKIATYFSKGPKPISKIWSANYVKILSTPPTDP